jgi:hypothetical protein
MLRAIDVLLPVQVLKPVLGSNAPELLAILHLFVPFFTLSAVIEAWVFS